jgi:RNA polymerase sigma factor (sigma-70 family)
MEQLEQVDKPTDEGDWLAEQFQAQRPRLQAVAYRMLGSRAEADDAVQETWIQLSNRTSAREIRNLEAWLVTVVGRLALNMLRTRKRRREESLDATLPDPIIDRADGVDPEHEALLADSLGLALLVVLETLTPAERLAYVLHDMFSIPFDEIGTILDRSPAAARQLASRARTQIRRAKTTPDADPDAQHEVVRAFLTASRDGDLHALVAVLDPDVVVHDDMGGGKIVDVRGADSVARRAASFGRLGLDVRPALINGAAGWVSLRNGQAFAVAAATVQDGRITALHILIDPLRLSQLNLTTLDL